MNKKEFVIKKFFFNGWNDFLNIQKDKSYDVAVVFLSEMNLRNLPDFKKVKSPRIIMFHCLIGKEDDVIKHFKVSLNNIKLSGFDII